MPRNTSTYKFDPKTVWRYTDGNYKAFVPRQLNKKFEKFLKKNKIDIKIGAHYNYYTDQLKKANKAENILQEGVDYIIPSEIKDMTIQWLKQAYKELD